MVTKKKTHAGETPSVQGPGIKIVSRASLPKMGRGHGTEAQILSTQMWKDLVVKLEEGLGPQEAVEIDYSKPLQNRRGDPVPAKRFAARLRYQLQKKKYSKKYSLIVPGKSTSMYIVDYHQSV